MKSTSSFIGSRDAILKTRVCDIKGAACFGLVSSCHSLGEVLNILQKLTADETIKAAVAYGMLLAANLSEGGEYRDNTLEVLNNLGKAKAVLDLSFSHTRPTVNVTGEILFAAQKFVDELTIPCTEWPTSAEVVENVFLTAKQYVKTTG